jgi:hypothetical protein
MYNFYAKTSNFYAKSQWCLQFLWKITNSYYISTHRSILAVLYYRRTYVREQVAAEYEREEQFIFLEERPADVAVEVVGEVIRQVAKTTLKVLRLGTENNKSGR